MRKKKVQSRFGRLWYMEQMFSISKAHKMDYETRQEFEIYILDSRRVVISILLAAFFAANLLLLPILFTWLPLREGQHISHLILVVITLPANVAMLLIYWRNLFQNWSIKKRAILVWCTYGYWFFQNALFSVGYAMVTIEYHRIEVLSPLLLVSTLFMYLRFRLRMGGTIAVSVMSLIVNQTIHVRYALIAKVGTQIYQTFFSIHFVMYILANILGILSSYVIEKNLEIKFILARRIQEDRIDQQKQKDISERFLRSLFPAAVAEQLKTHLDNGLQNDTIIAESFEQSSIIFADICGFTKISSEMSPEKIVGFLNEIFSSLDKIQEAYPRIEKIKTIGDGLQHGCDPSVAAEEMAEFALEMREAINIISQRLGLPLQVRIGVTTGNVVAGVIGQDKFSFDVWGAPINLASMLESSSSPGRVQVSQVTFELLKHKYDFEDRGIVDLKVGKQHTYFLEKRKFMAGKFVSRSFSIDLGGASESKINLGHIQDDELKQSGINRITLRFVDPALNSDYKIEDRKRYKNLYRVNGIIGILIYILFGVIFCVVEGNSVKIILLGVGGFICLLVLSMLYIFGKANSDYFFQRPLMAQLTITGFLYLMFLAGTRSKIFVEEAIVINVVFNYAFFGLPFLESVIGSLLLGIISVVLVVIDSVHWHFIYYRLLIFFFVNVVGLTMAYSMEKVGRESFFVIQMATRERKNLELERAKSDNLLRCILPQKIAERLNQNKRSGAIIADTYYDTSVLFASIHNFTQLTAELSPIAQVGLLNKIFSRFDALATQFNLQKIKTIGDGYMIVGGLPTPRPGHLIDLARMALEMQKVLREFNMTLRIGISVGSVVAGVLGTRKLGYDLWSDTVNSASRMESTSLPSKIQTTEKVYESLKKKFDFKERGLVAVKGKGQMRTFFLESERTGPSTIASVSQLEIQL